MALVNLMSTKLAERFQNLAIVGKTSALTVMIVMGAIRLAQGMVCLLITSRLISFLVQGVPELAHYPNFQI